VGGPNQIYIVAYGSSSCPPLPTTVQADGQHHLIVKTKEHLFKGDIACTNDLAATTSTVKIPKGIDVTTPLRIDVNGTVTTLDPR
jgi:hypothetical protein